MTTNGATYDDHFGPDFVVPPVPAGTTLLDWPGVTEHVARAERVSEVVREAGLEVARARFAGSGVAIEVATLAAAAYEGGELVLDEVIRVLQCPIDGYIFYAPFLELMVSLASREEAWSGIALSDDPDSAASIAVQLPRGMARGMGRAVQMYEEFVAAYARALSEVPHGSERVGAVRDGLADFYVRAGRLEEAEALFVRRHEEDQRDVAVALSASRAFLAAGSISHAVRWLGISAVRAMMLGRDELAHRLRAKQERVRGRLS
ncbi:MAG TPA: hypothetical protein VHN14_05620 [Kofleriaceae bacterium]|nr:hypothetical protein [Kofleriaceae bacterium]